MALSSWIDHAQVHNLITRATKRVFVLRYYSKFMEGKDLFKLYTSLVRSVIEYSSVTYHFLLTKTKESALENVQKWCLRCIFGYNKSYDELLAESGMSSLADRREKAVVKFTNKTLKNPVYAHWFKRNPNQTSACIPTKYQEEFARTSRLYNSPLFYMRRLLNQTRHDPLPENDFIYLAHLFDDL